MQPLFRKIGLALSAAAILFTALCLPLHYHEEQVNNCEPSHCSVCHFSKEAKASIVASFFSGIPIVNETPVTVRPWKTEIRRFYGHAPQRAPPSA